MKKVLLSLLGIAVLGVVTVLALASRKPDTFRFERRTVIAAPPGAVFAHINDFHRWVDWSPYEKLDTDLQRTYSGAPSGEGAIYTWKGKNAGEGQMTITESRPGERVVLRLEFTQPFAATNMTTFTFEPKAGGTEVSWGMAGDNSFMSKVISVFVDMDSFLGKDFDQGLANLKRVSEAGNAVANDPR